MNNDKKIAQSIEVLDTIGQENEKEGIKWTKHFMDLWDKQQWRENQLKKEKLKKKRKFKKIEYFRAVAGMLQEEAQALLTDVPAGYSFWSEFSGKGVILKMRDTRGKIYQRAFKPDGTPEIDFQAVVAYLAAALDTAYKIENERKQNLKDMGLILPN